MAQSSVLTVKIECNTGEPLPLANMMYVLVCVELDYHRAQYSVERDTLLFIRGTGNFNWCSMVVELEVKLIEQDTQSANQSGRRIGIGARWT